MRDPLDHLFEGKKIIILDGALATELERRGASLDDTLWSASVLLDQPDLIRQLHYDYLAAGADIITSASYQATFEGLARTGLSTAESDALLQLSVALAIEARDQFWSRPGNRAGRRRPLVAASVGPYAAFLADGSEYGGNYGLSVAALAAFHRPRLNVLATSGADLLACETIPALAEVDALCDLLAAHGGIAAWMSVTCRNDRQLSHGDPFVEAVRRADACDQVVAIGVNCTAPRLVAPLLRRARDVTAKPLLAYPNSGERWEAASRIWLPDTGVADFREPARLWAEAGARLIGGCCRTGPSDIAAMSEVLRDRQHSGIERA